MQSLTATLSRFVSETNYEAIPVPVRETAKRLFLDFAGCVFGGVDSTEAKVVRLAIADYDESTHATLWGTSQRGSIQSATLANTAAGEGRDFTAGPMVSAESNIIPAAAAVGEKEGCDGKALVTALVLGVEVQSRILAAVDTQVMNNAGFYHQAVVGPFGATTAVAKLLGLSTPQIQHAYGLSGSSAGGLFGWIAEGVRVKALQIGTKGCESITACVLAKHGCPGPAHVLEAERGGLFNSFSPQRHTQELAVRELGEQWMTPEVPFKPYPCCRWIHPYIDCLYAIFTRYDLVPEDIDSITAVGVADAEKNVMNVFAPTNMMESNFSLPFVLAVGLYDRKVTLEQFAPEKWSDLRVSRLARRVRFEHSPAMEAKYRYKALPPFVLPGGLSIRLRNGSVLTWTTDSPRGMPENAMSESEIVAKFRSQAGNLFDDSQVDRMISAVLEMETVRDIRSLIRLFSREAGGSDPGPSETL